MQLYKHPAANGDALTETRPTRTQEMRAALLLVVSVAACSQACASNNERPTSIWPSASRASALPRGRSHVVNMQRAISARNLPLRSQQTHQQREKAVPVVASLDVKEFANNALVPNIVANSLFASLVLKLASHTLSGPAILHSWILGLILWGFAGWKAWLIAVLYFATGSAVTMVRFAEKQANSIAEKAEGRRSPANVWGSGFVAAVCATLSRFLPAYSPRFRTAMLASFATKLADTTSSEIGKAFGKRTIILPSFQSVPPGTEGGISLEGTLAGLTAASALAYLGVTMGLTSVRGGVLAVMAAMVATTTESLIGSTLQRRFPAFLTNELVNVVNTMIGAAVAYLSL